MPPLQAPLQPSQSPTPQSKSESAVHPSPDKLFRTPRNAPSPAAAPPPAHPPPQIPPASNDPNAASPNSLPPPYNQASPEKSNSRNSVHRQGCRSPSQTDQPPPTPQIVSPPAPIQCAESRPAANQRSALPPPEKKSRSPHQTAIAG